MTSHLFFPVLGPWRWDLELYPCVDAYILMPGFGGFNWTFPR